MGAVQTWCSTWWTTNAAGVKADSGRKVTEIYQGGDGPVPVGAGGVCLGMATFWLKSIFEGNAGALHMLVKQGQVAAASFFARRQAIIQLRQAKIAQQFQDQVNKQLATIMKYSASAKPDEKEAADAAVDSLLAAVDVCKVTNWLDILKPLCGGGLKVEQLQAKKPLKDLGAVMDATFEEKTGGHYLLLLQSGGKTAGTIGGGHAVAFWIADGEWRFMDPNACEWEFTKGGSMKKLVTEFAAKFYAKEYPSFDLYVYKKA